MPTITGTGGADTLPGTGQAELIEGLGGDDVIGGGGGADTILGGAGNDRIVFQLSTNPPTQVDGGSGVDILDFSAYDSSRFFYNQPLFIRSGATPDTLSVSAYFFERGGVGTTPVVLEATGIERLLLGEGTDVDLVGTSIGRRIESHVSVGLNIKSGSGDDVLSLTLRQDIRAPVGYQIDGGAGSDLLVLSGNLGDYLIQQTGDSWTIYHGSQGRSIFSNLERVEISPGNYATWQEAALRDFDSAAYLANYADLRNAFGTDQVRAFQHYQQYGKAEGRVATAFDGLSYIASYSDLIRAFGPDNAAGVRHYTEYGAREGRTITFDGQAYAAAWVDLAQAFGTDATAAARHYIIYGQNEGRATSGFDTVGYLLSNPDVAASLAFTPTSQVLSAARTHWLTYGADEGRPGEGAFGRDQSHGNPALTPLNASGQSVTNGVFEIAGDKDWFFANLPTRTTITVNGSDAVTSISVYDVRGKLLLFDADGRGASFVVPLETSTAAAGSVYIVVTSTGTGGYTLTTSRAGAQSAPSAEDDAGLAAAANAMTDVEPTLYGEEVAMLPAGSDAAGALPWLDPSIL